MNRIDLTQAEWQLMEKLWDHAPQTGRELTEAMAAQTGWSEVYFRRAFRAAFGTSPLAYIRRVRLENAKALLRTGYYSVTETATRCGFDSVSYFSYTFRRETGVTPSAYRERFL